MKIKTLSLLAGVSAPLIMTAPSDAGFVGITTTLKANELGLLVVNVYAIFDRPGTDHMVAVAGTPKAPMFVEVIGGTFYQHMFGTDRPPTEALVNAFPSLAFDSFVTIGVKILGPNNQPTDAMLLTPTWPGFGASTLEMITDGWAITPENAQGNPFDAVNTFPGNGQVLLAQFSSVDGSAISGTFLVQYVSNDVSGQSIVSFFAVPTPGAVALLGMAGLIGVRRRRRR